MSISPTDSVNYRRKCFKLKIYGNQRNLRETKKMNYKILKPNNLNEIIPFTEKFNDKNIIIDLSDLEVTLEKVLSFKEVASNKIKNGTSFVIINSTIMIDELPDEINIVPTVQEAVDVIEMDEMMRELE